MTTTEKTKPTFTQEEIKQMRAGLLKLTPDAPVRVSTNRPLVTKEAIMALAPTLIKMRNKGVSTAKLIDFLAAQGLVTQPGTLNRYLNAYQKNAKSKAVRTKQVVVTEPAPAAPVEVTPAEEALIEEPTLEDEPLDVEEEATEPEPEVDTDAEEAEVSEADSVEETEAE